MSEQTASLNVMGAQLRARWQAMALRERRLVMVMAWLLAITLLVLVGVRPAWKTLQQAPAQQREIDATLDEMQRQADEVRALRQLPAVPPAQAEAALRSATEQLGEGAALRMLPDRVTVTLTKVPGPALARWLSETRTAARARPIEANIAQVEPGVYSGSVSFTMPATSDLNR